MHLPPIIFLLERHTIIRVSIIAKCLFRTLPVMQLLVFHPVGDRRSLYQKSVEYMFELIDTTIEWLIALVIASESHLCIVQTQFVIVPRWRRLMIPIVY